MMKIKFILLICICSCYFYGASLSADDDFQQWKQQQTAGIQKQKGAFQEYKDKRDKDFSTFLKTRWKAVDVLKGKVRDEEPKPDQMPVAQPEATIVDSVKTPVVVSVPEPLVKEEPEPVVTPEGKSTDVDFYGKQIRFYYDADLKQKLNKRIDKESVSEYWSALSQTNYEPLLVQLKEQKYYRQLNDWAYASLVNKLALKVNDNQRDEAALLSWFILAKSGYRARVAYNDTSVYLLVPSQHELFEVTYFTFSGKRYYVVAFDGVKLDVGRVYTYDGEYPDAIKDFDMQVNATVASADQSEKRHLTFEFEGRQYDVDVAYDSGRVKFFSSYPQLNLNLYFGSGVYKVTATPLQKQLAVFMEGMSEQQAVNFLLRFVQTSLKYETDEKQFGKENYLFPEETLFYPYSDCEDRAVLFSWLVKSLLNLDVVGLDYPGHVAAAVSFNEEVKGDSVSYKGRRYVVTDPTYINASAGMSMPNFKQYAPTIIAY
jgi:hypothetical protein